MTFSTKTYCRVFGPCVLVLVTALVSVSANAEAKQPFSFTGYYTEGCSCSAPCPCELVGVKMGCQGVGAFAFDSGKFDGVSLAGAKIAYAVAPGDWVLVYVEARDAKQKKALDAFSRAALKDFGKAEAVKDAKISISKSADKYEVTVDGGKIMRFTTEPILGGDGKTPLSYSNIHDPLHPTVMQGKTLSGNFKDGAHSFTLEGTNAYFNSHLKVNGKV